MGLLKFIEELLITNENITIPGLGSFLVREIPARVNKEGILSPQRKELEFNSLLIRNDGKLANYLKDKEKISYQNAMQIIRREVKKWKGDLDKSPIYFSELGKLSKNSLGIIEFVFNKNNKFANNSFGLNKFDVYDFSESKEQESEKQLSDATIKKENDTSSKNFTYMEENKNNKPYSLYDDTPANDTKSNSSRKIIIIIFIIIILVAGYYFGDKYLKEREIKISRLTQEEIKKRAFENIFITTSFPEIDLTIPSDKSYTENNDLFLNGLVEGGYRVISGSYRLLENAERRLEELKKQGFNPDISNNNSEGLYRVSFGVYQSKKEAISMLYFIRVGVQSDAWFLENN